MAAMVTVHRCRRRVGRALRPTHPPFSASYLQEPDMVSAVFHSPSDASDALRADKAASSASPFSASHMTSAPSSTAALAARTPPAPPRAPIDWSAWLLKVLSPVAGLAVLIGIWALLTMKGGNFPTPLATWQAAVALFADPFYSNGPNDQGIGWNILFSLKRVAMGFGLAALVGIPMGFIIGRSKIIGSMLNPIISLLRPVSPLAWLPIGLLVFKSADPAAI